MRGNSYPGDGPGAYLISGYFGIWGFPWLAIGLSPIMAQMKDDTAYQELLLSSPNTSDRQGSAAV